MPAKKSVQQVKSSSHLPTALVAGAAGFIGSHLCDALILQNCLVYGIDNFLSGKKQNLNHLLDQKNFVFFEHDLNKPLKTNLPQVDYVFHLAGIEAYVNGLDVSLDTLLVNSLGSRELLEIAKKHQAKFLLASTTDIFSARLATSDLTHYFGSDHVAQELYSHHEAKRFSEALTFEYVNRHQLDARVVRLAHVYGPRMDLATGTGLAKLFLAAKKGDTLEIPGNGLTPLYPTFVSDIVYGLTKAMFTQSSTGEIYTLLNPEKITLLNVAYKIKEVLADKGLKIDFVKGEDTLGPMSLPKETLNSQQNLGWTSKVDLEEGITRTLEWLQSGQAKLPEEIKQPPPPETPRREDQLSLEELGIKPAFPDAPKKNITIPKFPALPKFKLPKHPKLSKLPKLPQFPGFSKLSRRTKTAVLTLALALVLVLGPLVLMIGHTLLGVSYLNQAASSTDLTHLDRLEKLTTSADRHFQSSRRLLRSRHAVLSAVGAGELATNLDQLLFIGGKLSQGTLHLAAAAQDGTLLASIVLKHQDGNLDLALNRIKVNLDQAYSELSFVESELQSGRQLSLNLSTPLSQKLHQLTTDFPAIRQKVNQARVMLPLVPDLIAQNSKKTYLILFQNNAEIRPTGGFIGSYGLLTFEKGKLLDFTVEDIYAADGQLSGFVEPPEPLKEFLGQNSWFFRDSNWDPDFTVSGPRAEWFLNKSTGRNVDGVIAVNLPAAREFLKVTGPVKLPDFNEETTATNLFERAEYRTEIDFFPGSTQKKDFLGSLARELFDRAQNASAGELLQFTQALETAMTQKQILLNLHDEGSQKILLEQNWAGALYAPLIAANPAPIVDYFYPVEANLGINKANYFLNRELEYQLTILKTKEILSTATITYQNQSPADAWPGGNYRSYLRAYIPAGSRVISVKVGETKLDPEADIDASQVGDKLVLGFPVTVPVKHTLAVEMTYRLPGKLATAPQEGSREGKLAVVIPKQPGIIADPVKVIVNHPSFLLATSTSPRALTSAQVTTFESDLSYDRVFTVDFIEK
ncbi:hypothetical protein A3D86_01685 [Candidatus Beckwithbacteria bacterium RIFCSPHIGHO2_02_FULL_49_13]|nr:MAG: hypothetical protein A3D86_01685 [Candidatus Beckwithbacteria bacterium RIFCSPHIGHO2_02_FULL_49_13]